jgi:hypothetical protein
MKEFKCESCGKILKTAQTLKMHSLTHNKKENKDTKEVKETKNYECSHEFIVLNGNNANQKKALNDGYSAYCKKCAILI